MESITSNESRILRSPPAVALRTPPAKGTASPTDAARDKASFAMLFAVVARPEYDEEGIVARAWLLEGVDARAWEV